MLKQLIEDVNFEVCKRTYLDKVGRLGQTDMQISLLGFPLITPQKIQRFLENNYFRIIDFEDTGKLVAIYNYPVKINNRNVDVKGYEKFIGESVGIYLDCEMKDQFLCLREVNLDKYGKLIPESCLDKAIYAKDTGFFDYLTVGYPESMEGPVKDPVIFGRRNDSPNRFFIAQWDNDVTLDDLL